MTLSMINKEIDIVTENFPLNPIIQICKSNLFVAIEIICFQIRLPNAIVPPNGLPNEIIPPNGLPNAIDPFANTIDPSNGLPNAIVPPNVITNNHSVITFDGTGNVYLQLQATSNERNDIVSDVNINCNEIESDLFEATSTEKNDIVSDENINEIESDLFDNFSVNEMFHNFAKGKRLISSNDYDDDSDDGEIRDEDMINCSNKIIQPMKRSRGRPSKNNDSGDGEIRDEDMINCSNKIEPIKRARGRPSKNKKAMCSNNKKVMLRTK
jgi:hypothetical protein